MGTRGLRVYRVHGIYYQIYVHCDSYPTGLGKKIAKEIPTDPENFKGKSGLLTESLILTYPECSLGSRPD